MRDSIKKQKKKKECFNQTEHLHTLAVDGISFSPIVPMAIECDIIRLKRADSGKLQRDCSYFRYALIYPLEKCMEDNKFSNNNVDFCETHKCQL